MGVQAGRDGHVALHNIPACGHIVPLVVAIEKILDNNAFQHRVFGAGLLLAVFVQIGIGARIIPGVTVGEDAIVGAGAVIIKDVPAGATVVGNPGKIIKLSELSEQ